MLDQNDMFLQVSSFMERNKNKTILKILNNFLCYILTRKPFCILLHNTVYLLYYIKSYKLSIFLERNLFSSVGDCAPGKDTLKIFRDF